MKKAGIPKAPTVKKGARGSGTCRIQYTIPSSVIHENGDEMRTRKPERNKFRKSPPDLEYPS